MPQVLITTSRKPNEVTRRLGKFFSHFIKRSKYITRGKYRLDEVIDLFGTEETTYLLLLTQYKPGVYDLSFFDIKGSISYQRKKTMRIWNVIDHYIFGYDMIPTRPPMSTGHEFQQLFPDISEILQEYFSMKVGERTETWIVGTETKRGNKFQLIDSLTMKPFFEANIKIVERFIQV